ncbi:MAG: transketolase C-terminal domain-containing protein, partial [Pseudomonadota bacterium]
LSVAYANRNVKIVVSHPGLDVGPDGGSAQAIEDLAAFRAMPGMTVLSPADPYEVQLATEAMLAHQGPVYMRTGRSPAPRLFQDDHRFEIGRGQIIVPGRHVTIIGCGVEVSRCLAAGDLLKAKGIEAEIINMPTIKPIDAALIRASAEKTGAVVTAEDHSIIGGLGSAVAETLATSVPCPVEFVGVTDRFGESGEPEALAQAYGLSAPHIERAALRALERKVEAPHAA